MWGCLAGPVGVLAHAAGLDERRLVNAFQVLRTRLSGKGLDGGQRRQGGLLTCLGLEGLLIRGHQVDLALLLGEQIVWDYWHREAGGLVVGVSRRRVLQCGANRGGKVCAGLREDVWTGAGVGGCCRIDGVGLAMVDGAAHAGTGCGRGGGDRRRGR